MILPAALALSSFLQEGEAPLQKADGDLVTLATSEHFVVVILSTSLPADRLDQYQAHAQRIIDAAKFSLEAFFTQLGYEPRGILKEVFGETPTRRQHILIQSLDRALGQVQDVYHGGKLARLEVSLEHPRRFSSPESLDDTVAHEIFHVVQMGYDSREDRWLMEATATAVCDQVWPDRAGRKHAGTARFVHDWYATAELSLSTHYGTPPHHAYGASLFFQHLREKVDDSIMRRIWELCADQPGRNALDALDRALREHGTGLGEAFRNFASAVLLKRFQPEYDDALRPEDLFANPAMLERPPAWPFTFGMGADKFHLLPIERTLPPLSACYVRLRSGQLLPAGLVTAFGRGGEIWLALHLRRPDGSWREGEFLPCDAHKTAAAHVQAGASEYTEAVAVFVNTDPERSHAVWIAVSDIHPGSVTRVWVVKKGARTIYSAELKGERWHRSGWPPSEPVPLEKKDALVVTVETTPDVTALSLRLGGAELSLKPLGRPERVRRWMIELPAASLAGALKKSFWLPLEFMGENGASYPLDGDPATAPTSVPQGPDMIVEGYEPQPDLSHALLLQYEENEGRFSDGCVCSLLPPVAGEFVAARCLGRAGRDGPFGAVADKSPPQGPRMIRNAGILQVDYLSWTGGLGLKIKATLDTGYDVDLRAYHPDFASTSEGKDTIGHFNPEALDVIERELVRRGFPRVRASGPSMWENVRVAGSLRDLTVLQIQAEYTGRLRLTRCRPDLFEGHFQAPVSWNLKNLDDEGKPTGAFRGEGKLEICFRLKPLSRTDSGGRMKEPLARVEKDEREKLARRLKNLEEEWAWRIGNQQDQVKSARDRLKELRDRQGEPEVTAEMLQGAEVRSLQAEVYLEMLKKEKEQKIAGETEHGEALIRARILEAEYALWERYLDHLKDGVEIVP
jgi:hypothetical protein